jgi:hypothetical protein
MVVSDWQFQINYIRQKYIWLSSRFYDIYKKNLSLIVILWIHVESAENGNSVVNVTTVLEFINMLWEM